MKPVVLLIPGMLNTAAVWDRVAPLLQDAAEVRIADVMTQASITDMARDAWALLVDVAPTTPVVVCGFSMGGYVAIDMVAQPARSIAGLVLVERWSRGQARFHHTTPRYRNLPVRRLGPCRQWYRGLCAGEHADCWCRRGVGLDGGGMAAPRQAICVGHYLGSRGRHGGDHSVMRLCLAHGCARHRHSRRHGLLLRVDIAEAQAGL